MDPLHDVQCAALQSPDTEQSRKEGRDRDKDRDRDRDTERGRDGAEDSLLVRLFSPSLAAADRERLQLFSWFHVFLGRLRGKVKLVGSTISCTYATHVQSYALALDFVTLQLLWQSRGMELEDVTTQSLLSVFVEHQQAKYNHSGGWSQPQLPRIPHVHSDFCAWQQQRGLSALRNVTTVILGCHRDFYDTVFNGEIGISQAVLRAGYSIEALELYWRGVDFTAKPPICSLLPSNMNTYNHYENGVPDQRLRVWGGVVAFNDPQHVVFTKKKTNKHYGSDQQLQAILSWELLYHRAVAWQRNHTQHSTAGQQL